MFVAVVGVIGVVGVVAANHGDYSDYSDHSNHSQYGDSAVVQDIKTKEEQLSRRKEELKQIRKMLRKQVAEELFILKDNSDMTQAVIVMEGKYPDIDDIINNIDSFKNEVLMIIEKKLERELDEDKKELVKIDAAIMRINQIQLTDK